MSNFLLSSLIKEILRESSPERRAKTRAITGGRINQNIEMWRVADSLITDPPTAFFTLTHVQKVGINPQSQYDTPLGLYSYPVSDEIVDQLMGVYVPDPDFKPSQIKNKASNVTKKILSLVEGYMKLPFVYDAPYITFFKVKPAGVFYTSIGIDGGQFKSMIQALRGYTESLGFKSFDNILHPIMSTFGGKSSVDNLKTVWELTQSLAHALAEGSDNSPIVKAVSSNSSVIWRRLMIEAGVNVVVDDAGLGVIHPNEPTQAVIFKMSSVEIVQQFDNRSPSASLAPGRARQRELDPTSSLEADTSETYLAEYLPPGAIEELENLKRAVDAGQNAVDFLLSSKTTALTVVLRSVEDQTNQKVPLLDKIIYDSIGAASNVVPSNFKEVAKLMRNSASKRKFMDPQLIDAYAAAVVELTDKLVDMWDQIAREDVGIIYHFYEKGELDFLGSRQDLIDAFTRLMTHIANISEAVRISVIKTLIEKEWSAGNYRPGYSEAALQAIWPESGHVSYTTSMGKNVKIESLADAMKRLKKIKPPIV
jgi:hypothetical protein